ncbi:MAG: Gfo/Idh/MocA family oxidoreductase [Armatimonadetes bacterium]|nr:Gfo/Idh/MocA family oxidoreductase [Armatimonadota bacterium]
MSRIRVGVIGCGVMGPRHAEAAAGCELTELVAVADLIPERARETAARFDVARVYGPGSDLIADPDVDLVVLAMPAHARTALALQAFAAGKHVLTEKPVAMDATEVEALIAARGSLKAACCSSRYRFLEGASVAAEFVASGALGQLRTVWMRSLFPAAPPPSEPRPEWRLKRCLNGGGFLMNWGCYDLDYLLGITGWRLQPQEVFAQCWPVPEQLAPHLPPGSDAETHYVALVRCADGTMLSIERGEYMAASAESGWQIVGDRGSLTLTMTVSNPKRIIYESATTQEGHRSEVLWEGDENTDLIMTGPLTDLAAAIVEDREPMTSLEKALVVQRLSDAIYRSAQAGTAVSY